MNKTFLPVWIMVIGFLFLVGCATPEEEDILTAGYIGGGGDDDEFQESRLSTEENHMAIIEYMNPHLDEPGAIEKYAKAKVLILLPTILWNPNHDPTTLNAIRAINPDIKILAYINAHATWVRWIDRDPELDPYQAAWDEATRPYWSYTTTGDTMMSWPGKVLLNVLDDNCRNAMVDVLAEQWTAHGNVFDGVFWDHFNTFLWVPPVVEGRDGEMDLDRNGIPHRDDPEEMQAYRDASTALVQRFSSVLGSDIVQITNGNRAVKDSVFAGLVDGMMYEIFPTLGFSGNEMRNALDPAVYNNIFTAHHWPRTFNGGPYLYLVNKRHITVLNAMNEYETWRRSEFNRVAALLTDNLVTYHPESEEHSFGWPEIELDLGSPLGGVTFSGETITREFENGRVYLDFTVGNSNAPFQFEIEQNGQVVQQFLLE